MSRTRVTYPRGLTPERVCRPFGCLRPRTPTHHWAVAEAALGDLGRVWGPGKGAFLEAGAAWGVGRAGSVVAPHLCQPVSQSDHRLSASSVKWGFPCRPAEGIKRSKIRSSPASVNLVLHASSLRRNPPWGLEPKCSSLFFFNFLVGVPLFRAVAVHTGP